MIENPTFIQTNKLIVEEKHDVECSHHSYKRNKLTNNFYRKWRKQTTTLMSHVCGVVMPQQIFNLTTQKKLLTLLQIKFVCVCVYVYTCVCLCGLFVTHKTNEKDFIFTCVMSTHEEEALQENFLLTIFFIYIHINKCLLQNNKEGIYLYA